MKKAVIYILAVFLMASCAMREDGISRDEALKTAFEICRNLDWPFAGLEVENRITQWVVLSKVSPGTKQVVIKIDKKTGKVLEKTYGITSETH